MGIVRTVQGFLETKVCYSYMGYRNLKAYKKSESSGADYVPGAEFDIPVQSQAEEPKEKTAEKPVAKDKSAKTTKSPF